MAICLQNISDAMKSSRTYSIALDACAHQSTSYLDVRVSQCMFKTIAELLDVFDNKWIMKIIVVTSDGAPSMTGRYEGTVMYIF